MLEDLTKFSPSIVEILKVGVSGFAFLMAFLGYMLLRKEQDRDAPRPQILNMIRFFVCATVVFGALVGATVLLQRTPVAQATEEFGHEGHPYVVESSVYFVDLTHWKKVDISSTERQSKVPVLRVDRVRKVKQVDEPYSLPFYSRGLEIGFEPLVSPVTATFEKVPPPQDYKIAYEFQVALQRQPVGFDGDLVNRFTFWNGFQNEKKEDWKAMIKYPTRRVVVQMRFPNDKPSKSVRVYREELNMPKQIPEVRAPIRSPDGLVVVWTGENLRPGQRIAFEFEW